MKLITLVKTTSVVALAYVFVRLLHNLFIHLQVAWYMNDLSYTAMGLIFILGVIVAIAALVDLDRYLNDARFYKAINYLLHTPFKQMRYDLNKLVVFSNNKKAKYKLVRDKISSALTTLYSVSRIVDPHLVPTINEAVENLEGAQKVHSQHSYYFGPNDVDQKPVYIMYRYFIDKQGLILGKSKNAKTLLGTILDQDDELDCSILDASFDLPELLNKVSTKWSGNGDTMLVDLATRKIVLINQIKETYIHEDIS